MKTIVGLGNPGEEYKQTRHNAGRMVLEYFAKKNDFHGWQKNSNLQSIVSLGKCGKEKVMLILPETFMNNSGKAVKNLSAKNIVVLHDDIDLALGKIKISYGRGSGGHKGVESVIRALKTKNFWRLRIGVSPKKKPEHKKIPDFLLSPMRKSDLETLKKSFKKISEALEIVISESHEKAMNLFN